MLGVSLIVREVRVLANAGGEGRPVVPFLAGCRLQMPGVFRSSEKATEERALLGRTIRHETSCNGRGKVLVNVARKSMSLARAGDLNDRDGKSAMVFCSPGQCCKSWGPCLNMR